jgi:hypothetical protein
MTEQEQYEEAMETAAFLMEDGGLEPTSAFKQAASDAGIPEGPKMAEFVDYANSQLFGGLS